MSFKKVMASALAAGTVALGFVTTAGADEQPPSPPQYINQVAGGLGSTTLYARIAADGTHGVQDGLGLVSSAKLSTGSYEVIFRRQVANNCIFVPVISRNGTGTMSPASVNAVNRGGNVRGVFVTTNDATGAQADSPFSLYVYCQL